MDEALLTTLRIHNPWLEEPGAQKDLLRARLPGRYIPRTARLALEPGRAEMVVGPRQAGKSTWILESLSHIPDPVLILQAEEPRIRELCRSPARAVSELAPVLAHDTIILLEEVQHLDDAPLFIKGLVDIDRTRRIIVTGSSSFQLGGRTRESLAGRARRTRLLPLGLHEVSAELDAGLPAALRQVRLLEIGTGENQRTKLNHGLRRLPPRVSSCTILNPGLLFVHGQLCQKAELGPPV